jgi:hypothetical protein
MKMIMTERKLIDAAIFVIAVGREKDENRPCRSILKIACTGVPTVDDETTTR